MNHHIDMNSFGESQPLITPARWLGSKKLPDELAGCDTAIVAFCRLNEMRERLSAVPFEQSIFSHLDASHQYTGQVQGKKVLVAERLYGGPQSATILEEMAYHGIKKVIGYGYSGSLTGDLQIGEMVLATSAAVSDGTSREYLPDADVVYPDPQLARAFRSQAAQKGYRLCEARAWTTDALYRETPAKIRRWREAGCDMVNMDTSYFYAVSQVAVMAAVYACVISDRVDGSSWVEGFGKTTQGKERLFDLVIAAAASI